MGLQLGNTFDATTKTYGHVRKVFRSIEKQFPGGGVISNVADWVSTGVIPAGTPIKFDASAKTIVAYTDAQVKAKAAEEGTAATYDTLGINALLQEDAVITNSSTVATGTAVYGAEVYEYMYKADTLTGLKAINTIPQIIFVR